MPIIDYEQAAKTAENTFFINPQISQKNKDAVKKYLQPYNVRPATKNKFFQHIAILLKELPDITTQMHDRDLINTTFNNFKKNLSKGYISTLINVSKAFVRWTNDGDLPKGFKDIKCISKKDQMRKLSPTDMWSWEEGLTLANLSNSLQFKAIILTQIDAGFRPSEFVDLNYGAVVVKDGIVVFNVADGKTGQRIVPCQRCVPYFLRWYHNHPTKNPASPLWITEFNEKSFKKDKYGKTIKKNYGFKRYEYSAILKRINTLKEKSSIKKNCDFYVWRHSSCALDKKDNVPVEIAANRHGHTVKYFTEIYGRLNVDEVAQRLRSHYTGGEELKNKVKENVICVICSNPNEPNAEICFKCNSPLSVAKAMRLEQSRRVEIEQLKKSNENMLKQLSNMSPILDVFAEMAQSNVSEFKRLFKTKTQQKS